MKPTLTVVRGAFGTPQNKPVVSEPFGLLTPNEFESLGAVLRLRRADPGYGEAVDSLVADLLTDFDHEKGGA